VRSQEEIAKILGISQQTISRWLEENANITHVSNACITNKNNILEKPKAREKPKNKPKKGKPYAETRRTTTKVEHREWESIRKDIIWMKRQDLMGAFLSM
jgi:transcriptional regulator with XRE-family HTH domain